MMTCIGRETLMGHFCTTRENDAVVITAADHPEYVDKNLFDRYTYWRRCERVIYDI